MSKKDELVKNLHEQLTSGEAKVHTKTKAAAEDGKKELKQRQEAAFIGGMIYLTTTLYKLDEMEELGATKMKTKMLVRNTIKSMEHDLDTIFAAKNEDNGDGAALMAEGSEYLEKGLEVFLKQRTQIYEE